MPFKNLFFPNVSEAKPSWFSRKKHVFKFCDMKIHSFLFKFRCCLSVEVVSYLTHVGVLTCEEVIAHGRCGKTEHLVQDRNHLTIQALQSILSALDHYVRMELNPTEERFIENVVCESPLLLSLGYWGAGPGDSWQKLVEALMIPPLAAWGIDCHAGGTWPIGWVSIHVASRPMYLTIQIYLAKNGNLPMNLLDQITVNSTVKSIHAHMFCLENYIYSGGNKIIVLMSRQSPSLPLIPDI